MVSNPARFSQPSTPLTVLLAWTLPGLGHWYVGERARGVILFVVTTVTFWGGVAVGGVRTTVTRRENGAWIAAQLCMGPQAVAALFWGEWAKQRDENLYNDANRHKASWPSSNIAVVYAGITGLLNLLIIIDALARAEAVQAGVQSRAPPHRGGAPGG